MAAPPNRVSRRYYFANADLRDWKPSDRVGRHDMGPRCQQLAALRRRQAPPAALAHA